MVFDSSGGDRAIVLGGGLVEEVLHGLILLTVGLGVVFSVETSAVDLYLWLILQLGQLQVLQSFALVYAFYILDL